MKKTAAVGLGTLATIALAFAAKDPVIMTVNGVDVPKSEFEYLYNKNSQQQINPQTLDEYVEMFKLYKMKVADARAEGLDTVSSFVKEAEQYRHDLAAPYLTDSLFINQLVKESYDRMQEEVEAHHIMLFKTRDMMQNAKLRQRADSLHEVLVNGGDFADLAARFSEDRNSSKRGGNMGWMIANTYPVDFEITAYTLPEGQISEVVESPVGYHILKGGKHRPARGKVRVGHILKLTQGKDEAGKQRAKAEIDSLYELVKQMPNMFSAVATQNSDDRGSARQGGMLPFFGAGEMVAQFDSVSFSLTDGQLSEPFETPYGYHIVRRFESQPVPSLETVKPQMVAKITSPQDPRFNLLLAAQTAKLAKNHKASINQKTIDALNNQVLTLGLDSVAYQGWLNGPVASQTLYVVDGVPTTVANFASTLSTTKLPASEISVNFIDQQIDRAYNKALVTAEEDRLLKSEPDYANLLREYVDGSLLYEVSVRKVWDKAAKDTEGLTRYFEANRDNYKWTEPHAKGFLVQATNDSVANLIRERAAQLAPDTLAQTLRKEFKGKMAIDRVLVSKGTNAMVDNLMFGGPTVTPQQSRYQVYFMINPRLITEPEDINDVKGLVTSDYQTEYQTAWEDELRRKYPVKVNEKVLKSVKKLK